ncbi:hypothetical protein J2S11_000848 [Bacillus horti]|uniref:Uncharacterized protein n=1 Tax=Caldalkalibacillus horti TaxID=77523 RepID=A0ABT9VVC7_9BACI|nr:hypothetical protein [Bacillus horti]
MLMRTVSGFLICYIEELGLLPNLRTINDDDDYPLMDL